MNCRGLDLAGGLSQERCEGERPPELAASLTISALS